ncbi:MAG: hypothetical protein HYR95_01650 [Candidatus Colwellbacteria bacterium]|nr:hypothetical protein [Candidatus Colwellbacteria bacterium]
MRPTPKNRWFKPFFWGWVLGALMIMIAGFAWWGWVLGGTAESMAKERADTAVAAILAPVCVENFMKQPEKLAEFRKTSSWQQREVVQKSGWATTPGNDRPNQAVVTACVEELSKLKS